MSAEPPRRYDLDVLRVAAFLLLIVYHLGMFYVPWPWHVKSDHIVAGLEPWMTAVNPWRLTLLFVISGAATRLMAKDRPTAALAAQRSQRLLLPLLFGMLVIVAPQSWAEVAEKQGYAGSFLDFWPRYLTFDQSFGIILPTYNHLWFVAYLWIYTMLALALRPWWPTLDTALGQALRGPRLLVLPILLFGLYRLTAWRAWGETHIFFADAYGHLQYGSAFLLGLVMARLDPAWTFLQRMRTALAVAALACFLAGRVLHGADDLPAASEAAVGFLREAYAWTAICALFGYARRYIHRGSPLLTTLTEAVFPFYIIHQTAIVLGGHLLKPLNLPVAAEAGTILAVTIAACLATYALARAAPALRLPLGLKPAERRVRRLSAAE